MVFFSPAVSLTSEFDFYDHMFNFYDWLASGFSMWIISDQIFEDVFGMMSVYERVGDRERRMGGKREREREREAGWLAFQQFSAFFESPYTNLFLSSRRV